MAFKEASDNSYTYVVTWSSWEGGLNWETTITVANGHVTRREFKLTPLSGSSTLPPEVLQEWVENQDELNSHADSGAADILTMDQIYKKAKNDWLQERSKTITYFETENDGLISVCGYMPKGCADDCFRGITISSIVKLN